jgi:hypothetical protein
MAKISKKQFSDWLGYDSDDVTQVIELVSISDPDGVYTMLEDMGKEDMAEIVSAIYFDHGSLKDAIIACKEDLGLTESKNNKKSSNKKIIKISEIRELVNKILKEDKDPCWKGYKQAGMKDKNGKKVPNCIKEEESCNECDESKKNEESTKSKIKKIKLSEIRTLVKKIIKEDKNIKLIKSSK